MSVVAIRGLATGVPRQEVTQDEATALAIELSCETDAHARRLRALHRRSGVQRRAAAALAPPGLYAPDAHGRRGTSPTTAARMAWFERHATPLARDVAARALADARVEADAVAQLVTVSCTGFAAPGVDLALVDALALPRDVGRTHIGFMGCHGLLNGLRVARALALTGAPDRVVLLVATELCSLHLQYGWRPAQSVAHALFADGAAALVLGAEVPGAPWHLVASGSCVLPDSTDAMSWRIADHGFEMTLSARVPDLIATSLGPWLARWLEHHDLRVGDVAAWAIHPGGPRVVETVGATLGLSDEHIAPSRAVLARHGNMSSPTVSFILDALRARGAPSPCVALAFGPGLAIEAALLR